MASNCSCYRLVFEDRPPRRLNDSEVVIVTFPACETRARNGPCLEWRILQIFGNADKNVVAICRPRRLPAVRTNTLALLALSAAISRGRYCNLWSLVRTTQPRSPTVRSHIRSSSSREKWSSWISTSRPALMSSVRIGSMPSDRSMKNTV